MKGKPLKICLLDAVMFHEQIVIC